VCGLVQGELRVEHGMKEEEILYSAYAASLFLHLRNIIHHVQSSPSLNFFLLDIDCMFMYPHYLELRLTHLPFRKDSFSTADVVVPSSIRFR
jgi:hypothetical protein